MCNEMIRQEMKSSGIYCWQVADALNIAESTFYRMMRHELPENAGAKSWRLLKDKGGLIKQPYQNQDRKGVI